MLFRSLRSVAGEAVGYGHASELSEGALQRAADAVRAVASGRSGTLAAPPADPRALPDDTVVCRCEEVTAGELRALIAQGHDSPASLKRACRVGMGRCQGRYCAAVVARLCSADAPVDEFGLFAPRPPAKPAHSCRNPRPVPPHWGNSDRTRGRGAPP